MLTSAAAFFRTANALMRGWGMRSASPPMSKFCTELQRFVRSCQSSASQSENLAASAAPQGGTQVAGWVGPSSPVDSRLSAEVRSSESNSRTDSPLRLSAIVAVCGNLELAERVALDAELVLAGCDGREQRHGCDQGWTGVRQGGKGGESVSVRSSAVHGVVGAGKREPESAAGRWVRNAPADAADRSYLGPQLPNSASAQREETDENGSVGRERAVRKLARRAGEDLPNRNSGVRFRNTLAQ